MVDPRMPSPPPPQRPAAPAARPADAPAAAPAGLKTEQEKDQSGAVPGVGPASPSEVTPGPVQTIEEQGIGPRTPYPDGDPPPPSETSRQGQGIKGVTDKPALKPGEARSPGSASPPPPPHGSRPVPGR